MKNLRAVFGALSDLQYEVAQLDALSRQKPDLRGFMLESMERRCAGIETTVEDEYRRLGKMLGFRCEKVGAEVHEEAA